MGSRGRNGKGTEEEGKESIWLSFDEKLLIDPSLLSIGQTIGQGAHGFVHQGRYKNQLVAVKVLVGTSEERNLLEKYFTQEVNMISRVNHENLVKFIGACIYPKMLIVTELLSGMSLRRYLTRLRPQRLDLPVVINFALDIARAMDYLHANGIIHRDLKSDNLLLTANQRSVKVVDFGLAREDSETEMMTAEIGTYRWMAPEMYNSVTRQGDKTYYNNKVDVYSFGVVLWELVTNEMPFSGMSCLQAAYAAGYKKERPSLPEDISPDLAFVIQSCWAEDPNARPSFSQIIRILNAFFPSLQEPCNKEPEVGAAAAAHNVAITQVSTQKEGKFSSFARNLFALKKTKSKQQ